jgi:hypothetical protein
MKSPIFLRIASIITLLYFAGHGRGGVEDSYSRGRDAEQAHSPKLIHGMGIGRMARLSERPVYLQSHAPCTMPP